MKFVNTYCLHDGMILAQDLLNKNGNLLLRKGQIIRDFHIAKIKEFGYTGIYINEEEVINKDKIDTSKCMQKRVLVVDDSLYMRKFIGGVLTKNNFTIAGEAENGEIATMKYAELHPDIVTMDITMPVLDGVGALEKIKDYDKTAKVIMISSMGQDDIAQKALNLGASTFVVKPFKDVDIIYALNKALEA